MKADQNKLDIRFFVDEATKTVACTIYPDRNEVYKEFQNLCEKENVEMHVYFDGNYQNSFLNRRYCGKAKCHPEDTFDVEKGKEIAKARAMQKYDEAKLMAFQRIANRVSDLLDRMDRAVEFYECRFVECSRDEFYATVEDEK